METHIKVCMKSDWSMYLKQEDFNSLHEAMVGGKIIEIQNLFGTRELIDGGDISTLHISTVESRAMYEDFEKMLKDEGKKEEKQSWE